MDGMRLIGGQIFPGIKLGDQDDISAVLRGREIQPNLEMIQPWNLPAYGFQLFAKKLRIGGFAVSQSGLFEPPERSL